MCRHFIGLTFLVLGQSCRDVSDDSISPSSQEEIRESHASAHPPPVQNEFFEELKTARPSEASHAITAYFWSGQDVIFETSFELGPGGQLISAPTLRTALFDLLCQSDPEAAKVTSQEILARRTSADEWVLALRHLAQHGEDAVFLEKKTLALITDPVWQAEPTAGYYAAFDLLAYLQAAHTTPILSAFICNEDGRRDLRHVAFLTLDKLTVTATAEMMRELTQNSALQSTFPGMVAQQMARADLRDPEQRAILKEWLLDPTRPPNQIETFLQSFPNHDESTSPRLITSPTLKKLKPDEEERQLAQVRSWLTDQP